MTESKSSVGFEFIMFSEVAFCSGYNHNSKKKVAMLNIQDVLFNPHAETNGLLF